MDNNLYEFKPQITLLIHISKFGKLVATHTKTKIKEI